MLTEDEIRDQVLDILQVKKDWMTDREVLAYFGIETARADIWKAFQSLVRQKLIEGKHQDNVIRWRVVA